MPDRQTVKSIQTRRVIIYSELWDGSTFLYEQARGEKRGSYWKLMSCAVLTAFTLEAYLNHVGPAIFKSQEKWDAYERRPSPVQKLTKLCEKCRMPFETDQRPGLSIQGLFDFRKLLAHGRNELLKPDEVIEYVDEISEPTFASGPPTTWWEKFCSSIENIEVVRKDVEQVIRSIQKIALPDEPAFSRGLATRSTTFTARGNSIRVEPQSD